MSNQLSQVQQRSRVQIQAHGWHQLVTTVPQVLPQLQVLQQPRVLQHQLLRQLVQLLQQRRQQQHVVGDLEDGAEDSSGGEMEDVYR